MARVDMTAFVGFWAGALLRVFYDKEYCDVG